MKRIAYIVLSVGCILTLTQIYTLTSQTFARAEIISTEPYLGECRRPSGRYEDCALLRAHVTFRDSSREEPIKAILDIGRDSGQLSAGSIVMVMYPSTTPEAAVLATLRRGWTIPLGVTAIGLVLLFLARNLASKKQKSGAP